MISVSNYYSKEITHEESKSITVYMYEKNTIYNETIIALEINEYSEKQVEKTMRMEMNVNELKELQKIINARLRQIKKENL
jgi:hypothetical protein